MATKCFTPMLGKRIRVTTLDNCGAYPAPATPNAYIATDGFMTVNISSEIEDGAEILTKKADGSLCVNEKFASSFKRLNLEIEFCGVNPSLLSMVSNARAYNDYAGRVAGFTLGEGLIESKFAFELWTGLSGAACATPNEVPSGYLLLPFVNAGQLDDLEVNGEDAISFKMSGAFTKGMNNWGIGPYNVLYGGATTNEVQTVTITGTPTGGSFKLTFMGETTANIAHNAAAAAVQTALEALPNIAPGDVVVTGGPGPATPYVVTFGGVYAGTNVPAMTASNTFTGGTSPAVAVTTTTGGLPGVASKLPTGLDQFDHLLLMDTGLAPPPAACDPQTMP